MPHLRRAFLAHVLMLLLVLAAPVLAAAQEGTPGASPAPAAAKVLRVEQGTFPQPDLFPLDPQKTCCYPDIAVSTLDFEGLTRLDGQSATVPAAAESWAFSDDLTVLTFTLREGLTYADGSPLTAERFRYAIARTCDPRTESPYAYVLFAVVGCEALFNSLGEGATPVAGALDTAISGLGVRALDDRILEIQLTQAAPYFPTVASLWVLFPVKQELVEADPDGWWADPATRIGNGPFRLSAIDAEEPDQRITFVPNESYWLGPPKLDGIEYVYFPEVDDEAELEAYRRGELDIVGFPSRLLQTIQDDPELSNELLRYPAASTITLTFNLNQEPFQDKQVREAFAYAMDRAAYCEEIQAGLCLPTLSWIPPGVPGHIETDAYAFDPEQARRALAASSYGGPEALPEIVWLYAEEYDDARTEAEWLAAQLDEVLGVELTLRPVPEAEIADAVFSGDPDALPQLSFGGWFQDYPDPQNWMDVYWTCGSPINASVVGYCNPELDELIALADLELDPEQRLALYEEAQHLLIADAPVVFLFNTSNAWLVKPHVREIVTTPQDLWPGSVLPMQIDIAP